MTANTRTAQSGGIAADWRSRAAAVVGATVATTVIWLVANALGAQFLVDERNGKPPTHVDLVDVIPTTLIAGVVAWGVLALLKRFTDRVRTIWTRLAVIALGLSYVLLIVVGTTAGTKISLFLMHTTVAAVLISVLRRGAPDSGKLSAIPTHGTRTP